MFRTFCVCAFSRHVGPGASSFDWAVPESRQFLPAPLHKIVRTVRRTLLHSAATVVSTVGQSLALSRSECSDPAHCYFVEQKAHQSGQAPAALILRIEPVPRAIRVKEEAPGCEDADGKCSSENDSLTVWQQMAHLHREKKYWCRFCPFSSSESSGLKKHERTHTGEKPFSCAVCHKVFAQKGSLQSHERIHTGEKPFRCQTCQKAFSQKCTLQAHERIHTGEKPFRCQTCTKAFSHKSNLQAHERIHTGERPFRCQTCDMAFAESGHLTRHRRVHMGDKPFRCGTCEASFKQRFELKCHERLHGVDPAFYCKQCGEKFVEKADLNAHQKEHHP